MDSRCICWSPKNVPCMKKRIDPPLLKICGEHCAKYSRKHHFKYCHSDGLKFENTFWNFIQVNVQVFIKYLFSRQWMQIMISEVWGWNKVTVNFSKWVEFLNKPLLFAKFTKIKHWVDWQLFSSLQCKNRARPQYLKCFNYEINNTTVCDQEVLQVFITDSNVTDSAIVCIILRGTKGRPYSSSYFVLKKKWVHIRIFTLGEHHTYSEDDVEEGGIKIKKTN
jgi:hypothetical protein